MSVMQVFVIAEKSVLCQSCKYLSSHRENHLNVINASICHWIEKTFLMLFYASICHRIENKRPNVIYASICDRSGMFMKKSTCSKTQTHADLTMLFKCLVYVTLIS